MAKKNYNPANRGQTQSMAVAILKRYGVPGHVIKSVMWELVNAAIQESKDMKYDRIYAAMALASHRAFGYGAKRIIKLLRAFDDLSLHVAEDENRTWDQLMVELRNETGLVVRTDEKNRLIFEYAGADVKEEGGLDEKL